MEPTRQCPKCGLDLTDTPATTCPMCGARIVVRQGGAKVWLAALLFIAFSTAFLLALGYSRTIVGINAGATLLAVAVFARVKAQRPGSLLRTGQRPVAHPVLFKIFDLGVAAFGFLTFATLLFSFVIFMNGRTKWKTYEGRNYRVTDFQVTRVYYKEYTTTSGNLVHTTHQAFASGMVEGKQEWMNLMPFLHIAPRGQHDLEGRVPVGTVIRVFLFPDLRGQARVLYDSGTPPAEQGQREESGALRYGPLGAVGCAGMVFLLVLLRAVCRA